MAICELCENRVAEVEVSVPDMGAYKFDVCKTCLIAFHNAAQQLLAPDSPYVCLHCGAHISSDHLPWCKSLPQNGGR